MWQFPLIPQFHSLPPGVAGALRIAFILIVSGVLIRALDRFAARAGRELTVRLQARAPENRRTEIEKRVATVTGIVRKAALTVLVLVALMMVLNEAGFDIAPILAGAGIAGLAVGFGAQSLVKDVITGLFLLAENQMRIRDVVTINGQTGLVEEMNLRTTVLRSSDGAVHVFPNGAIHRVTNLTLGFAYSVFDIAVAYREDPDRVVEILRQVSDEIRNDSGLAPAVLEPVEVLGVDRFASSAVIVKARVKTAPGRQWAVAREVNRRLKKKFDAAGIRIPVPHRTVCRGEGSRPFRVEWRGAGRLLSPDNR